MTGEPEPSSRVSFGPFRFDPSAGELRKHDTRLRLTGHPLRILTILLARPNQVIAREELQQLLWNGTTFVDFDHGLNTAINKLRQTLGDSADQPRYVETVPGKGYRFVAPVSHETSVTRVSVPSEESRPEVKESRIPEKDPAVVDKPRRTVTQPPKFRWAWCWVDFWQSLSVPGC